MNCNNAAAPAIVKTADATNRMAKAASAVAESGKKAADATKAWEKALKEWNEQMKLMDDARAHWLKAEQDKLDLIYKSIESEQKTIDGIRQTTEGYDKQAAALTYTTEELLKKEQARVIEIANNLRVMEGADRLVQAYDDQAAAIGRLIDANKSSEFKKSLAEQEAEFKRTYDSISNTITDALMRGFESGKDWAKNFIQTLKNMFATLVLRPIIQAYAGAGCRRVGRREYQAQPMQLAAPAGSAICSARERVWRRVRPAVFRGLFGASGFTAGLAGDAFLPGALAGGLSGAGIGGIAGATAWPPLRISRIAAVAIPMIIKALRQGTGKPHRRPSPRAPPLWSLTRAAIPCSRASRPLARSVSPKTSGSDRKKAPRSSRCWTPSTSLDNTISPGRRQGHDEDHHRRAGVPQHHRRDGHGGTDINASGGPAAILKDRYVTVITAIDAELGEMVTNFEGSGDALATFVVGLVNLHESLTTFDFAKTFGETFGIDKIKELMPAGGDLVATFTDLVNVFTVTNDLAKLLGQDAQEAFGAVGLASAEARRQLIEYAGGIENLSALMTDYYQNFYTEAERTALTQSRVTDEFVRLQTAFPELLETIPTTRLEFRALIESLQLSGEAGAQLAADLLKVAPTFASVTPEIASATVAVENYSNAVAEAQRQADEAARAAAAIAATRRDLEIQIMELSGDTAGALAARRSDELAAMDESLRPLQERIYALQDEGAAVQAATKAHVYATVAYGRSSALTDQIIANNQQVRENNANAEKSWTAALGNVWASILSNVDKRVNDAADALERITGEAKRLTDQADALKSYRESLFSGADSQQGLQARYGAARAGLTGANAGNVEDAGRTFLAASMTVARTSLEYNRDVAAVANKAFTLETQLGTRAR